MKISKLILLVLPLIAAVPRLSAQTKIGGNLSSTNAGAALEIGSTNQGILLPRVSLTNTTTWSPVTGTAAAGMEVFNSNTAIAAGSVSYPALTGGIGIYFWDGGGWVGMSTDAASPFWKTTGNTGTNTGINFIGTTDNQDFSFRRNGIQAGYIGVNNTCFGSGTLISNTSGATNSSIGANTFSALTLGFDNVAIGYNSSTGITTAAGNTAVGTNTLASVTSGGSNIAIGYNQDVVSPTASNQMNIGGSIFGTGLTGSVSAPAGFIGINTSTPGNTLEVNSGTAGLSGVRFTKLRNNSTAASANSVNGKYLSVDATGNVVLAKASDPTVDVTGLAANLTSPNSFLGATFSPNTPAGTDYTYINDADGSLWTYNSSTGTYVTYLAPGSTEWYLSSGTTDASTNKTSAIYRSGSVGIGTTTPNRALEVSATAGTPPIRTTNMTSSSANMSGTLKSVVVNASGDFGVTYSANSIAKIVNASVPVTLDSLKVEVVSGGAGFMLATTAGTLSINVAGWTNYGGAGNGMPWYSSAAGPYTVTTTFASPFVWAANTGTANAIKLFVTDLTHNHGYEITILQGVAYANNLIEIRRML